MAKAINPIQIVAGFQVRSPGGMDSFITRVSQAIRLESRIGRKATFPTLANLQKHARRVPKKNVTKLSGFFAKIRDYAATNKAPQTAAAVVQAARWFYHNVEQEPAPFVPTAPSAAPVAPVAPASPQPRRKRKPKRKLPLTKQVWFVPAVSITVLTVIAATVIAFKLKS